MAVVTFDVDRFLEAYPHIAKAVEQGHVTTAQIEFAFQQATLFLSAGDDSGIPYDPDAGIRTREILLWLLVCHIVTISLWPLGVSGPVSSASQGSVSTSFQLPTGRGPDWYRQTPCGLAFWQATRRYTVGGRYMPKHYFHPWG